MKVLALCLFISTLDALAGQVETTKDKVPVLELARRTANTLTTLAKGETLPSRDRIGKYWEVQIRDGRWGFVDFMSVKFHDEEEESKLSQKLREAVQKRRKEGGDPSEYRTRPTTMGVRGLQGKSEASAAGSRIPNLHAIYIMEILSIPKSEIDEIGIGIKKEIQANAN